MPDEEGGQAAALRPGHRLDLDTDAYAVGFGVELGHCYCFITFPADFLK